MTNLNKRSQKQNSQSTEKKIWCTNNQCKEENCVRHESFAPMNTKILVRKFERDPEKPCKYFLQDWPEEKKAKTKPEPEKQVSEKRTRRTKKTVSVAEEETGNKGVPGQMRMVF